MSLWSIFCKNVKFYRFKKILSRKLGELSDLSDRYISTIECGRYCPTFDTVEKIAKALDVEGYELFKQLDSYADLAPRIDIQKKRDKNKK